MENIKKIRTPVRACLTKTADELETEARKPQPDTDVLQIKLKKLEEVNEVLVRHNDEMFSAMLEEDSSEAELSTEYTSVERYGDRYRAVRFLVLQKLKEHDLRNVVQAEDDLASSSVSSASKKRRFKLPKVELRKFSGDMKDWLSWWAQYKKIHEDDDLDETDKFSYLLQSLTEGSRPRKLIEGYPQTSQNYPKAVEALKERFGDTTFLTEYYVRQLSKLVIRNASKTKQLSLSVMYDELDSSLRALESLGVTVDQSAAFLYPLVESSLPEDLLKVWQRSPLSGYQSDDDEDGPKGVDDRLKSLMRFLKREVKGAERLAIVHEGFESTEKMKTSKPKPRTPDCPTAATLLTAESQKCIFCDKGHESRDCGRAAELTLEERKQKISRKRCCFACLRPGHSANKCRSYIRCVVCSKKHFPLLCPDLPVEVKKTASCHVIAKNTTTVLETLCIKVKGPRGTKQVRALIDTGAERSYIKASIAEELGLHSVGTEELIHNVFGGGSTPKEVHNIYKVQMSSLDGNEDVSLHLLSKNMICSAIPPIRRGPWMRVLKKNRIWISDFQSTSGEVEVLFGADTIPEIQTGLSRRLNKHLLATETVFGWTIMGRVDGPSNNNQSQSGMVIASCLDVNEIDKLWRLEVIGITDPIQRQTQEERDLAAKLHFEKTVSIGEDGRYEVALPWIADSNELPTNYSIALSRLKSSTSKLNRLGRYAEYDTIFQDWLKEGLIEKVNNQIKSGHFLPHHPVFKPQSLTTPVRPVFDASCKDKRAPSLNDLLETGPNLLEAIPSLMNRFRMHKVGATADIRKAFQMISVKKEDREFLKFLWWDNWGNIITYRHTRVVFGVSSSPFLLAAVLSHHLSKVSAEYKNTAELLLNSLYVDNVVCSFPSMELYRRFKEQSVELLSQAKMELRQWEHSTVEETGVGQLLGNRCGLVSGSVNSQDIQEKSTTMVLGMVWDKHTDTLSCCDFQVNNSEVTTKRNILSSCARIFDPMGFLSPATLQPKLLLQETWALKLGWDSPLQEEMRKKFLSWCQQLQSIKDIRVPRNAFGRPFPDEVELHTFGDASSAAYAAVVFLRTTVGTDVNVQLLQSKSRVAPKKVATIPRLELLGCLVGARLSKSVQKDMNLHNVKKFYWTDSTTALAWIQRNDKWGTFVGNRVKEISSTTNQADWRYVPGDKNPADLPSRGCSFAELAKTTWWEGPEWLKMPSSQWPSAVPNVDEKLIAAETSPSSVTAYVTCNVTPWYVSKSSYVTNLRIIAWIRRFASNSRQKEITRRYGDLSVEELEAAENNLFRIVQTESFPKECSSLQGVRVFHAEDGIIRVLTKLFNKNDLENFRKPCVLPNNHPLTCQLIRYTHLKHGHAGIQFLMGRLREKVWILGGRRAIKTVLNKCVACRRYKIKSPEVEVASLPKDRVNTGPAFGITGVDLAGPLFLKGKEKAWVVIFTCAVYRAVHLELVGSLSTDAFLLALQKFVCRRGRPSIIWSDNGTNFRGGVEAWKKLDWKRIQRETSTTPIKWKFIPPTAAWWGGWWERLIRTLKDLLRKMLGHGKVSRTILESLLCEVESTMNARPLTYVTEDPDDLVPLTPEMFLHDLESSILPEVQLVDANVLKQSHMNMKTLREELKQRFRREYLSLLVHVGKMKGTSTVREGDIVLVGSDGKKRLLWPMGRIEELIAGADGKVRVAKVRVKDSIVIRPLQRLFPLEISSNDSLADLNNDSLPGRREDQPITTRYGRRVIKTQFYGASG